VVPFGVSLSTSWPGLTRPSTPTLSSTFLPSAACAGRSCRPFGFRRGRKICPSVAAHRRDQPMRRSQVFLLRHDSLIDMRARRIECFDGMVDPLRLAHLHLLLVFDTKEKRPAHSPEYMLSEIANSVMMKCLASKRMMFAAAWRRVISLDSSGSDFECLPACATAMRHELWMYS
jgi:hypothetical protein